MMNGEEAPESDTLLSPDEKDLSESTAENTAIKPTSSQALEVTSEGSLEEVNQDILEDKGETEPEASETPEIIRHASSDEKVSESIDENTATKSTSQDLEVTSKGSLEDEGAAAPEVPENPDNPTSGSLDVQTLESTDENATFPQPAPLNSESLAGANQDIQAESSSHAELAPTTVVFERGGADDFDDRRKESIDDESILYESDDEKERPSAFAMGGGLNYLFPTEKIKNGITNAKYFWGLGVEKVQDKTETLKKDLPALKAAMAEKIQNVDMTKLKEQGNEKLSVIVDGTKTGIERVHGIAQEANSKLQVKLQSTVGAWLGEAAEEDNGSGSLGSSPDSVPVTAVPTVEPKPPPAVQSEEAPAMIV